MSKVRLKRAVSTILAAVTLIAAVPATSYAKPAAKEAKETLNGSFESGTIGKDVSGWGLETTNTDGGYDKDYADKNKWAGNYKLTVSEDSYRGSKAMSIKGVENVTKGYAVAWSDQIPVQGEEAYSFGYAIKIKNVESRDDLYGGKVLVYQYDAKKNMIRTTKVGSDLREDMDWTTFTSYVQVEEKTAYVRLGFYIGGIWNKNKGIEILVDDVSFDTLSDQELLNGGFEKGSSAHDIYSWHLTAKDIQNNLSAYSWASNYSMVRDTNGYHGDCVAITRNGVGYVTLDSNIFAADPRTSYVLDYAFSVENSVYDTFFGMRAYIVQFDKNKQEIKKTGLNSEFRENTPWKEMTHAVATEKDTAYMQIQFWVGGVVDDHFTARFDDVRLTKIVRQMENDGANNGNFEEIYNGTVFDWTMQDRLDMHWQSTFDGYNNTKGVKLTKPKTDTSVYGYAPIKSNRFDVIPGQNYKIAYMMRVLGQSADYYDFAQIYMYDKDGKEVARLRDNTSDHRTSSDVWQQVVAWYTVPEGAVSCQIEILVCGSYFTAYMDDVKWSICDDSANVFGFDAVDRDGNIAGWTVSQPAAVKRDTKVRHNGAASMFISQTLNTATCTVVSDVMLPLKAETRYKFTMYVKSYDCDNSTDGIRLYATKYDKNKKAIATSEGILTTLNTSSEKSDWRELICGVDTGVTTAYVRFRVVIGAGRMNLWLDDLKWKEFDGNEYIEDFDSIREDGTPDGWSAVVKEGEPTFQAGDSKVTINAKANNDKGVLVGRWNTDQEYSKFRFTALYLTTPGTKADLTIRYYDFADRELEKERIEKTMDSTDSMWKEFTFDFTFSSAKYATIEIANDGKGMVSLDGIKVVVNDEVSDDGEITTWRGKWVWYPEDHTTVPDSVRFFRRHVNLTDPIQTGTLQITGDDIIHVWINDVEVTLEEADDWESVKIIEELEQYMTVGDNVIAVSVENLSSAAGFLFDGFVQTEDGKRVDFYSDGSEIAANTEIDGWNKKDFNDSAWAKCRVIGPVGTSPWSNLEFDVSAFVTTEVEIEKYSVTREVQAGGECTLTMTLKAVKDIDKEIDLNGYLWIRNTTQRMYMTQMEQISGPPTNEWKAGKKVTVKYRFDVPDFLSEARYILQISVSQIRITNIDIANNKLTEAIRVKNDAKEATTKAELREVNGTQTIFINGEQYPNMTYVTAEYQSFRSEIADQYMHDAGICISRMGTGLSGVWLDYDEWDFSSLDNSVYQMLQYHSDTYLMMTLSLSAPTWWEEKNPDELIVYDSGKKMEVSQVSYASEKFVKEITEANMKVIEHMMQQPYANRIVGAVLCSCRTGEWLWWASGQIAQDFSKPGLVAWRNWLKDTYKTDDALQEAWNNRSVTLETAAVPTFDERKGATYTTLLDPSIQKATIDYATYMQDLSSQRLIDFARAVKEATGNRLMIGAYNGYLNNDYYWDASATEHLSIAKVLETDAIDFIGGPVLYSERYDGESAGAMMMVEGVLARGKAVMIENDTRTCTWHNTSTEFFTRDGMGSTYTVSDSLSQLERDFAHQMTRAAGQWYYNMWGAWFEHKQFSDLLEIMMNERKVNQARPTDYDSDICYIIDEDMYTYLAYGNFNANYDMLYWLLKEQRFELSRIGVPVDTYMMSDLEDGLVPDYKIYIMLAPVEIDASEKAAVEKYLKNGGKTVVWEYLAGASDGQAMTAQNMSDIIGMNVTLDAGQRKLSATFAKGKQELIKGIEGKFYGNTTGRGVVSPVGIVQDTGAQTLGYMYDNPSQPALSMKKMDGWTSIYSAVPCLPTEFFVNLLKECGAHIYSSEKNDVVFANDNYVAVNTAYGGDRTISLDGTYAVYDVYNCKMYSESTDTIRIHMDDKSTRLFRLMPENTVAVYTDVAAGGSSKQEGYTEVSPGKNYTCRIKADKGYQISAIIVDGERTEMRKDAYTVKFKDLDNSHFVRAEFALEEAKAVSHAAAETGLKPIYIWLPILTVVVLGGSLTALGIINAKKGRKKHEEKV